MNDYIDRKELLKELKKEFRQNDYIKHDSYFEFKNIVETMPTVDAVEVVRCKDCKHNGKPYCDLLTTGSRDWYIKDNDYCKWGEKE